jgi:hypothetical protein
VREARNAPRPPLRRRSSCGRAGRAAVALLVVAACRSRPAETRIIVVTATPAPSVAAIVVAEPTPEPTEPEQSVVFEVPTPPTEPSPPTRIPAASQAASAPSCLEQLAILIPRVEPLIEDFKAEREIGGSTPRLSLAPQITRLRDLYHKARDLRYWPDEGCGYRLREKVLTAEQYDIDMFSDFIDERAIYPRPDLWRAVDKELAELRSLIIATGTRP